MSTEQRKKVDNSDRTMIGIGRSLPRHDALAKVTGKERYAVDEYPDDFLWAGVKRAGVAHGLLKAIDMEEAKRIPGVVAILTHADIKGLNRIGIIRRDQPVLVDSRILHAGDAVALVLARERASMKRAIDMIRVDCEPLPAVFDPEEALRSTAPVLHTDNPDGNLLRFVSVETGDPEMAFRQCDAIVEETFELDRQEHAFLETESGWAALGSDGKLTIVVSTQTPFRDRHEMAPVLAMNVDDIRVRAPYLGGAFGGKDGITVQCLLGIAAQHSGGRPVKMWWDRKESFTAGVKRLGAKITYRLGAQRDGTFVAISCRAYFDAGAYANLCGEIMTLGLEHAGSAYRIPNADIKGWCVYTNNPVGGPFRGFGVPQMTAAVEQAVDILAKKLGLDPVAIRIKNALVKGDRNCIGVPLTYSTGIVECLKTLEAHTLWKEAGSWKKSAPACAARGVGVSAMAHAMGYPPVVPDRASAKIELTREGTIRVYAGVVDMGQGNATTYLQIAGSIMGQDISDMELVLPDTDQTLPSGSSSASRTTYVYGNALVEASNVLKGYILQKAADMLRVPCDDAVVLEGSTVRHEKSGKILSLIALAEQLEPSRLTVTASFQAPAVNDMMEAIYLGPHVLFSYGAHVAFIEIDRLTGQVQVKKYLAVTDAGNVLNPAIYEQQIHGSLAQGLGYALYEHFGVTEGHIVTKDLSTYIIPTAQDVPDMVSVAVETDETTGPFGMKGIGEIAISGVVPAVANAIADACAIRIRKNPFTAESVLREKMRNPGEE